jgi:hypothetical protein
MMDSIRKVARIVYHLKKGVTTTEKALVKALLDDTWHAIPAMARDSIVVNWSKAAAMIEFRDHLIAGFKPRTGGQTRDCGRVIIYRHDYLVTMPQGLARALIAHSLLMRSFVVIQTNCC